MTPCQHVTDDTTVSGRLLGLLIAGLTGGAVGFVAGLALGVMSR